MTPPLPVVVTGAGGRLGRSLRRHWQAAPPAGLAPIRAGRGQGFDLDWDILTGPVPSWPPGAVVLHLAGLTRRGDAAALSVNARLVPPLLAASQANHAKALLAASTIAVLRPGPEPLTESAQPDPRNAYGQSKHAAEAALSASSLPVTLLRIGNVAGADALLSRLPSDGPILLDPAPGQDAGPVRSWIGPATLARCFAQLCLLAATEKLPPILNIATSPPLGMADLLQAAGADWRFGPENPDVLPVATLDTTLLYRLCDMPQAQAKAIIAELREAPQ